MKDDWLRKVKRAKRQLKGCCLASYRKRLRKERKAWRRLRSEVMTAMEELDREAAAGLLEKKSEE